MRIALVSSAYAPAVGGVERVVERLASHLEQAGDRVEVWTIHHPMTLPSEEKIRGILVRRLPCPLPAADLGRLALLPKDAASALHEWHRAAGEFRPDILNVHCFSAQGIYATLLSMERRLPLVLTLHGETITDDHHVYQRSLTMRTGLRMAVRRAASVVAPSHFVLNDARRFGLARSKSRVIPNGVDLDSGTPSREPDVPEGRYILGFGRLVRNKGFDLLIEAFSRLADRFPSMSLILGGDGPERVPLSRMATELGVADRLQLTGWLSAQQVRSLLSHAALAVVPSRIESFGLAVVEGLQAGCPVVATTRGGVSEFIEDGHHALLVDPTDITALTKAMERILEDPELAGRLAAAGRDHAATFTWKSVAARYQDVYRASAR